MNAPFKTATRLGKLHSVAGVNVLALLRLDGSYAVNELFENTGVALAATLHIDFDMLIGTHATVELLTQHHGSAYFDGIVTHAQWGGVGENGHTYKLTLRPWLWLAGRRRDQRIFHEKSVDEILKEVFDPYMDLGDPAVEFRLSGDYPTLEYTVQYRESDLDFARRLMERFGISFHFEHMMEGHTLVLTDAMESFQPVPGATREFLAVDGHHGADAEHFWEWEAERNLTTGGVRLTDYNFKHPRAAMEVERMGEAAYQQGKIEAYDYPGDYLDQGHGRTVVGLRTTEERAHDQRFRALGDATSLRSGQKVTVVGFKGPGADGTEHLCLSATHSYVSDSYGSGAEKSDGYAYTGRYTFTPVNAPFAPSRLTPVPVVQGPQTATVVGEGEIDCDEFGRILVHFHWDLEEAFSMRCRVSQNWASKGWGGMVIPRIGMEVVVEFLEGDPDKPLVTGCVYNGANMPPYGLPANKSKSVFNTDSHEHSRYNELTYEDQTCEKRIYMHGQKDHEIMILNDRFKNIGRDQSESVGQDKSISVGRDHTETVGQDASINVARDVMYEVGQNQQEKYGKDHVHVVGNIHKQDIYADHVIQTGANHDETVMGKYTLNVTESITNNTKTHTLMAFQKFVIKGPGGKITLDASGVTIEGMQINLKGMVSMGGAGSAQVPTLQGAANEGLPLVEECLKQKGET